MLAILYPLILLLALCSALSITLRSSKLKPKQISTIVTRKSPSRLSNNSADNIITSAENSFAENVLCYLESAVRKATKRKRKQIINNNDDNENNDVENDDENDDNEDYLHNLGK
jgi:phosphopantothenoylcysteine synthetase/decarboxylase